MAVVNVTFKTDSTHFSMHFTVPKECSSRGLFVLVRFLAIRLKATRGLNIKVADLEVVIRDECIPSQISLEKALRGISGVLVRCRLRCPLIFGRDARQNTDSFRQLDPVM